MEGKNLPDLPAPGLFSAKCDTFYRDQNSPGKGHDLWSAAGRRVFRKELAVDFVDYAEVVPRDHKNGGFYDFAEAAAGFFQYNPDVLK
jgi:hypothetical protein